ncbi:MAG: 4-oxalocrotonate tautomerase DmpI [Candidatus Hodarchaeales archaeon]|jgi:4-oxalocrotonate tautomerase
MPVVQIDGPKINDIEIKRILVKEVTESLQKAYKLPLEAYIVIISENNSENVGVGGRLVIDRE